MEKLFEICRRWVPKRKAAKTNSVIPRDRKILMKKRSKLIKRLSREWDHAEDLTNRIKYLEEMISQSHTEEKLRNEDAAVKAIKTNNK